MKLIKLALISFVILFLLVTAISLLLPSTVNISRAIDINAPADTLYNNINDLAKWKNWYANYDSLHTSVSKISAGKGATMTINKTTVTITDDSAEKIKTSWKSGSKSVESDFNFFRRKNSSQITLQWHFIQHLKWYPWEKFASIVSDKVVGPAMEKSLDNLKKVAEK